jgi:NAD(P)-dependent dehydrogenase (short-subunit alcohol dehydrogenase family)
MKELRFDGQTVIVTGAGGNPSLGRSHALLLASRGANVVVNDIGSKHAPGPATAQGVVDEIMALGGKAVADDNSVATVEGAEAIVKKALDTYGDLHCVVNNAGIVFNAPFDEVTPEHFKRTIDVNLLGPAWMARAAWGHFKKKKYGRFVNIVSGSMFGFSQQQAYAASKGGLYSLTRSLAAEGEQYGIKSNSVAPAGFTRMVIGSQEEDCPTYQGTKLYMPPELVSPVVAFFAHESCPVSGECIEAMGGSCRRAYWSLTKGYADRELTIEKLAEHWDDVVGGASEQLVPYAFTDSNTWHNKKYNPNA